MGSPESEQVLALLKELSILKELDSEQESGPQTELELDAQRQRQQRHRDISEEIKEIAERKTNGVSFAEL
jgi:hypothetical protein